MKKFTILMIAILHCLMIETGLAQVSNSIRLGIFSEPLNSHTLEIRILPTLAVAPIITAMNPQGYNYSGGVFTVRCLHSSGASITLSSTPYLYSAGNSSISLYPGGYIDGYDYFSFQFSGPVFAVIWPANMEVIIAKLLFSSTNPNPTFELVTNVTWTDLNGGNYYQEVYGTDAQLDFYAPVASITGNLLPVELTSFSAEKKDVTTRLKWETVSEKDLFGYVIERSTDGKNFQDIGYVEAKAKSLTDKITYEDIDYKPQTGINYYRLRTKEKVKNVTYSKIVSVDFGGGLKTKTYPNPFSSELSIEIDIYHNISGDVLIDLFDTAGKQIYTKNVKMEGKKLIFNLPNLNLTPGNYIVRIKNGNDTWQQKITKS